MKTLLLCFLFSVYCMAQTATQIAYTYTLPVDVTNYSIGVKDTNGTVIRTITNGRQTAGTYSGIWDGNDDIGRPATNGPFTIAVIYGNPVYYWDGVIGNTSANLYGYDRWNTVAEFTAAFPPYAMRFTFVSGGRNYGIQGGAEGTYGLYYFRDSEPNTPHIISPAYLGQNLELVDIANDGQYLYTASNSPWTGGWSFVTKWDAQTGQPAFFTGVPVSRSTNMSTPNYPYVPMTSIDTAQNSFNNGSNALAVQQQGAGNLLAVAHGNWNNFSCLTGNSICTFVITYNSTVRFFDKNTGLNLNQDLTVTNPQFLAFDLTGNLWVLSQTGLCMVTTPGTATQSTCTTPPALASQLVHPVAFDINAVPSQPTSGHIYVLDGGSAQQMKEFDSSYTLVRTYGVAGGFNNCDPTVTHNKLLIDQTPIEGQPRPMDNGPVAWIRAEPNGDVWIADAYMPRIQHIALVSGTFTYAAQILFTTEDYVVAVDRADPTRVFGDTWEWKINYGVPNLPGDPDPAIGGNGAWQLVKNWAVGQGATFPTLGCGNTAVQAWNVIGRSVNGQTYVRPSQISDVTQMSNGRTYISWHYFTNTMQNGSAIIELPSNPTAPGRYAGSATTYSSLLVGTYQWNSHGDFMYGSYGQTGNAATGTITRYLQQGFTGPSGADPIWLAGATAASWTFNPNWQNTATIVSTEPTTNGTWGTGQGPASLNSLNNVGSIVMSTTGAKFSYSASGFNDTHYQQFNPQIISTAPGSSWTAEAWLKTTGAGPEAAVSYGDNPASTFWMGNSGGHFAASITGGSGGITGVLDSGIAINDGLWHHCAMVVVYGTGVTLYVDGTQGPRFTGVFPNISATANNGAIGRSAAATGFAWSGSIDEVAIFRGARYTTSFAVPTAAYAGTEFSLQTVWHYDNTYTAAGRLDSKQMHLSGVVAGRTPNTTLFTKVPETCSTNIQPSPMITCASSNNNMYPFTSGQNLFYWFCMQGQNAAPQLFHYWEDGMYIGNAGAHVSNDWRTIGLNTGGLGQTNGTAAGFSMGYPSNPTLGYRGWSYNAIGFAFNCQQTKMITVNGDPYLWTLSEQNWPTIQRWHISNLASIHEIASPPAALGSSVTLSVSVFAAQAKKKAAQNALRRRVERRQDQRN